MAHSKRTSRSTKSILNRSMLQGTTEMSDDEKSARKKPRSNSVKSKSSKNSNKRGSKSTSASNDSETNQFSSTTVSTKDLLNQLADDFEPGEFDVVCSRGKWAMKAPGNVRYRSTIKDNLQKYSETTNKQEKSSIVSEIVESIKDSSPQGGFVRCINGTWFTVTDHIAREKTGQSFRDMLHHQYRSSTKAKRRRQKEKDLEQSHAMITANAKAEQGNSRPIPGRGKVPFQGKLGKPSPDKNTGINSKSPKHASGSTDEKPIPGNVASGGSLITPASPLAIRSVAASGVFPGIPNPSNPAVSPASPQEAGMLSSMTMPQMSLAFTSNGMLMAQHQQYLQNPYMYDHTYQMYPGGHSIPQPPHARAFAFAPGQEQRIDLEPIPISESPFQEPQQRLQDPSARVDHASQIQEVQSLPHHLLGGRQDVVQQQQVLMQPPPPQHLQQQQHYHDQNNYQYFQPMMYQPSHHQFGAMSMHGSLNQPAPSGMGYNHGYGMGIDHGDYEESNCSEKVKMDPVEGGR